MYNSKYRRVYYQVKYKDELSIVSKDELVTETMVNHFAQNGYSNLYCVDDGKLVSVITAEDFYDDRISDNMNRSFIQDISLVNTRSQIESFFIDNPDVDRISVIKDGDIYCEIDSLIELPLQNGVAKNIMALRYFDVFSEELAEYFHDVKKVLLISSQEIKDFFALRFTNVEFVNVERITSLVSETLEIDYDVAFDFVYNKRLREKLGVKIDRLESISKILTKFAVNKLKAYCDSNGVKLLYYKLQKYPQMNCLNEIEYYNSLNHVKVGRIIKDNNYCSDYIATKEELEYLEARTYHSSFRVDDGYCFMQEECNLPYMHVHDGKRLTSKTNDESSEKIGVNFYGPCTTFGFLVPDDKTFPSLVGDLLLEDNYEVCVSNYAGIHGYNELNALVCAMSTPVRRGDYIIIFDTLDDLELAEYPNPIIAADWFNEEKPKNQYWFLDFPGHCNYEANRIISKHIYEDIKLTISDRVDDEVRIIPSLYGDFNRFEYLRLTHSAFVHFFYKHKGRLFASSDYEKIGAIMWLENCSLEENMANIRKASYKCDALYILKFNINLENVLNCDCNKELESNSEIPITVIQPDFFFYSKKYQDADFCCGDCSEKYEFTEKALKEFYNAIGVNTLFHEEGNV